MKKILVVDDDKDLADMMKDMLESVGCQGTTVYGGKECLQLLSKNNFDLLLLDISMPTITGIDVLKKIKSDPTLTKNKIVFVTSSYLAYEDVDDLTKQGALDIIKKPFTKDDLLRTVQKYA